MSEQYCEYLIRRLDEVGVPVEKRAVTLRYVTKCSKQAPYNWLVGSSDPNREYAAAIDKWLDRAREEPDSLGTIKRGAITSRGGKTTRGFVLVPVNSDIKGDGESASEIPFSKALLDDLGVDPVNAFFATWSGDTMYPLIPDGSLVGIDRSVSQVVDGKVFAVTFGELSKLRKVSQRAGGMLSLICANDEFPEELLPESDVTIIGQVFSILKTTRIR